MVRTAEIECQSQSGLHAPTAAEGQPGSATASQQRPSGGFGDRADVLGGQGRLYRADLGGTQHPGVNVYFSDIARKPVSTAFDEFAQQSPALLFFYPESYDRVSGLQGRVPVRLYDSVQPQDNTPLKCPQP